MISHHSVNTSKHQFSVMWALDFFPFFLLPFSYSPQRMGSHIVSLDRLSADKGYRGTTAASACRLPLQWAEKI